METYNGTTDHADDGYSAGVHDLNIFYDVSLTPQTQKPKEEF